MDKVPASLYLLRRCPLFKPLADKDLVALGALLRQRRLHAREILFRRGEAGASMIVVGEGRLSIHVERTGGTDALLSELGPGEILGEMSCLDPAPRSATATAQGDVTVFELDRTVLCDLRDAAPAVAVALVGGVISQLTARLRDTNRYIEQALPGKARGPSSMVMPAMPLASEPPLKPTPYRAAIDLSGLDALAGLLPRDLELLTSVAPPLLYPDGANLCLEGTSGSSCFLVAQGAVLVLKTVSGQLRQLAMLGPGSFVGQMALVDRAPRSATVRAQGEAVVLTLGREDFEKLLLARSALAMRFQEQIALAGVRQLRMATGRLYSILNRAPAAQISPWALAHKRGGTDSGAPRPLPLSQREQDAALSHIQTTLTEWDLSLEDLENISVAEHG